MYRLYMFNESLFVLSMTMTMIMTCTQDLELDNN